MTGIFGEHYERLLAECRGYIDLALISEDEVDRKRYLALADSIALLMDDELVRLKERLLSPKDGAS